MSGQLFSPIVDFNCSLPVYLQSFVVLGSFLLREFASIRYEVSSYKKRHGVSIICPMFVFIYSYLSISFQHIDTKDKMALQDQVQMEKKLEENIKEMMKLGANDEWKNIRGPRPWEDNHEYNALIESLKEKKKK